MFVLCGDGELQEGQNWEAMMAMAKWNPDNMTMIVDYNQVQLDGTLEEIMPLGDLNAKISSFGIQTYTCDGHNTGDIMAAMEKARAHSGPSAIIAKTIKGKGVSFMEGQSSWHGKPVDDDSFSKALAELEAELR